MRARQINLQYPHTTRVTRGQYSRLDEHTHFLHHSPRDRNASHDAVTTKKSNKTNAD